MHDVKEFRLLHIADIIQSNGLAELLDTARVLAAAMDGDLCRSLDLRTEKKPSQCIVLLGAPSMFLFFSSGGQSESVPRSELPSRHFATAAALRKKGGKVNIGVRGRVHLFFKNHLYANIEYSRPMPLSANQEQVR